MDAYIDNESSDHFQPITAFTRSPSSPENLPKKIKKSYRKRVEKEWTHEDTLKLIQEIEMRRSLWDVGCQEYKLPKEMLWQEVADATNMTPNNCKGKWANLRITFNANLEKRRKKKSGQGTSEGMPITWKYFHPMLFLESNRVLKSTKSTSSFQLNSATDDASFLMTLEEEVPVQHPNRRRTDVSTTFDSDTSQSRGSNMKAMAVEALQSMRSSSKTPKTPSVLLCEYMASELDTLSTEQATLARLKLRRAFNDIMEEVIMPSSSQQEHSRNVNFDTNQIVYVAHDPADTSESCYENDDSHDYNNYGHGESATK